MGWAATHRGGSWCCLTSIVTKLCAVLSATTVMGANPVADVFARGLEPATAAPCPLSTGKTFCMSQTRAFAPVFCSLTGVAAPNVSAPAACGRLRPRLGHASSVIACKCASGHVANKRGVPVSTMRRDVNGRQSVVVPGLSGQSTARAADTTCAVLQQARRGQRSPIVCTGAYATQGHTRTTESLTVGGSQTCVSGRRARRTQKPSLAPQGRKSSGSSSTSAPARKPRRCAADRASAVETPEMHSWYTASVATMAYTTLNRLRRRPAGAAELPCQDPDALLRNLPGLGVRCEPVQKSKCPVAGVDFAC